MYHLCIRIVYTPVLKGVQFNMEVIMCRCNWQEYKLQQRFMPALFVLVQSHLKRNSIEARLSYVNPFGERVHIIQMQKSLFVRQLCFIHFKLLIHLAVQDLKDISVFTKI